MRDVLNSSSPVKITLFSCYCGLGHLQFALSDDKEENRRPPFVRSTLNFPRTDYHVIQNPGRRVWSTPDWESSQLTCQCDNSPPTSLTMAWVTSSEEGGHFFLFFFAFPPCLFPVAISVFNLTPAGSKKGLLPPCKAQRQLCEATNAKEWGERGTQTGERQGSGGKAQETWVERHF